ncbi:MAG: hypothetical protein NT154_19010 [Verrucomicrobia bacterium]|nr:hypothetical protein [Verrucomicrobiota bacterium]
MKNDIFERPIRKEEAALLVGRSLRSLDREMKARRIQYYKTGKLVSFTRSDIEDYRARCLVKARIN